MLPNAGVILMRSINIKISSNVAAGVLGLTDIKIDDTLINIDQFEDDTLIKSIDINMLSNAGVV